MLKNLIKIASDLDAAGFKKEADVVDLIIKKVSSSIIHEEEADDGIPADVASEEEIRSLLSNEATPEEMMAYDDVQAKILEEEERMRMESGEEDPDF